MRDSVVEGPVLVFCVEEDIGLCDFVVDGPALVVCVEEEDVGFCDSVVDGPVLVSCVEGDVGLCDSDGPVLVFCVGFPVTEDGWDDVCVRLSDALVDRLVLVP